MSMFDNLEKKSTAFALLSSSSLTPYFGLFCFTLEMSQCLDNFHIDLKFPSIKCSAEDNAGPYYDCQTKECCAAF